MQRVEFFDQLVSHHLLQLSVLYGVIIISNVEARGVFVILATDEVLRGI